MVLGTILFKLSEFIFCYSLKERKEVKLSLKRMANGRKKKKFSFSKIYSLRRGKGSSSKDDHSRIGGPGFSRIVFCNEPDGLEGSLRNYGTNYVRTTKYTAATFFPKSLFEQFRRVANFYFLVTGILSFTSLAPYSAVSAIVPLVIVIGATMVKEGIEDWRRKQQVFFFKLLLGLDQCVESVGVN